MRAKGETQHEDRGWRRRSGGGGGGGRRGGGQQRNSSAPLVCCARARKRKGKLGSVQTETETVADSTAQQTGSMRHAGEVGREEPQRKQRRGEGEASCATNLAGDARALDENVLAEDEVRVVLAAFRRRDVVLRVVVPPNPRQKGGPKAQWRGCMSSRNRCDIDISREGKRRDIALVRRPFLHLPPRAPPTP